MKRRSTLLLLAVSLVLLLAACGRNMAEQPRYGAYDATPYFADGSSSQVPPANTVSREFGNIDPAFLTGVNPDGSLVSELPVELTASLLQRGRERYDIYCSVCHNYDGGGAGMAVVRGFPNPNSLHAPHLQDVPLGYFVQVITNGFGAMYPYASRVPAGDRWAIAAYIRALQLSQNATADDLPADIEPESGDLPLGAAAELSSAGGDR